MTIDRRAFLVGAAAAYGAGPSVGFRLTEAGGLNFQHNSGAYGAKYLPETMGPGCAFIDYDNDGWLDLLIANGMDWPGHVRQHSTLKLYRNNRNGTFTDVTVAAGLNVEMYAMGLAVADFDNDGWPDVYVTCVGQNRLFRNNKGRFVDVTAAAGLGSRVSFSTSALWFDYDRDGLLDLFVCNYVRWSPEHDVFCAADGRNKSYCTPEAYRGSTCWLFRNKGNGTFEDVTAKSGIFDSTSKSLGVAMFDYDRDGWLDLLVANDTQPNKLYRNNRDGTFSEIGVKAGVAFSEDGKARAGMGVDVADFENSGLAGIAITNFDNEMMALHRGGTLADVAVKTGVGAASRNSLGFGCLFADLDLDGWLDLVAVNGHIDSTARNLRPGAVYAQAPHVFLNEGRGAKFRDVAGEVGFGTARVARGLACGDFDRDGDVDLLVTTNQGPALLYRNDVSNGNKAVRLKLTGTKSNRDAVGALVRLFTPDGQQQTRMVKTGSSYLSQSELALTFGMGRREMAERVVVEWPSGRTDEFKALAAGAYELVEGKSPQRA